MGVGTEGTADFTDQVGPFGEKEELLHVIRHILVIRRTAENIAIKPDNLNLVIDF